ncbi:M57 family metalloprotease [Lactobacillus corticis]|uniref:Peptidase M10 metallopeptidase domain-containing protein n=1 Tax=Lactobacillus corticis TaxID=2201249 RepID=A0A916VJ14_9LACO|nr:M57 family metalloprotease [Lactobacillus corticis]GFZ26789.1 hypothetical protein LCB40_06690 [Lactobacillus corticis]
MFKFIKRLILVALLGGAIYTYNTNQTVKLFVQDSVTSLENRTSAKVSASTKGTKTWAKPTAKVYINIHDNVQLVDAVKAAIKAWNKTGAFKFVIVKRASQAQITINEEDSSTTTAAGRTWTTYNPLSKNLISATIELNTYYLQNEYYGYSQTRIINTVEHELGHAMGLSHSYGVSVMYPAGSYYGIQAVDVQDVKDLYGENN